MSRTLSHTLEGVQYFESILDTVGNTPLVRLRRLSEAENLRCTLLAKVETGNPGGSVKDRVAIAMVDAAERDGLLLPAGPSSSPRRETRARASRSSPRSAATGASS